MFSSHYSGTVFPLQSYARTTLVVRSSHCSGKRLLTNHFLKGNIFVIYNKTCIYYESDF